ncbi:MAG TPA: glycine zipper 2TM domain-containing protein [Thiobacillaceae bacterium]|nr:glycine zipper 2TM domain-containing protein [Thiobacillaceae bacterium]
MKAQFLFPLALAAGFAVFASGAEASDEALGAILGGATGAVIGHAVGGHNGAVAGGAFGAVVGAVAASESDDQGVHYGPPGAIYGPRL